MKKTNLKFVFIFTFLLCTFLTQFCFGEVISNWQDEKAYKPEPVLFLHGFAGKPSDWNSTISNLSQWFAKYRAGQVYLETIDFLDYLGSISTYKNGKPGWADRLNQRILNLLSSGKYGNYANKINLVAHSMGGLAAREYLTNTKYPSGYVDKLILIGTPNLGSPLASFENNLIVVFKTSSLQSVPVLVVSSVYKNDTDSIAKIIWVPKLDLSPGLNQMFPGSSFLKVLNNRSQPAGVKYEGIYGITGHVFNWLFLGWDYYGGDGIVSKDSQLATNLITFLHTPYQIKAFHTDEPSISVLNDNPLLKLLDSDQPQFETTSPDPSSTTTITESSIDIQGKVYKEYLPADSQLIVNITRQDDGVTLPTQTFSLKPSDLWIPNNPDSPVAEFKETLNLPGKGTYKISCQIQNPAGVASDIKDTYVNVSSGNSSIIVHCHNPEGKEINSITGVYPYGGQSGDLKSACAIYDGNTLIGYGAFYAGNHNQPISLSTGAHTIKVIFNGMVLTKNITLSAEQQVLVFEFPRTTFDLQAFLDSLGDINGDVVTFSFSAPSFGGGFQYNSNGIKTSVEVLSHPVYYGGPSQAATYSGDFHFEVVFNRSQIMFYFGSNNHVSTWIPQPPGYSLGSIFIEYPLASIGFFDWGMSCTKPIPSYHNDGFDNWYIQNTAPFRHNPSTTPIQILCIGGSYLQDTTGASDFMISSAKTTNPMMEVSSTVNFPPQFWLSPGAPTSGEYNGSMTFNFNAGSYRIDSVPYDLDGKAI